MLPLKKRHHTQEPPSPTAATSDSSLPGASLLGMRECVPTLAACSRVVRRGFQAAFMLRMMRT